MKGLLVKDLAQLSSKGMRTMLIISMVFTLFPFSPILQAISFLYAVTLTVSLLALDERSHWDVLARMMPYTTKQLVTCKYIVGWLHFAVLTALVFIADIVYILVTRQSPTLLLIVLILPATGLLLQAFMLSVNFCMGTERGRLFNLILCLAIGAIAGAGIGLVPKLADKVIAGGFAIPAYLSVVLALGYLVLAFGANALSRYITIKRYAKREL